MNRRIVTGIFIALALAAIGQAVRAEGEATAELPAVTVTAGRGESLEDMDVSTTVMTRQEIQQAPETSVEQILNKIPGVFSPQVPSNQVHPTGEVFSIRGFGTSTNINTLVMVDGIPINDPYFRILNWAQIPKDSIERIEIIRGGGASSLWGNLAMGGIVNIVLREPQPGEKRINASYGSFNTKTLDGAATLFSSDRLKIGLNLGGTKSDGYNLTPKPYRNRNMVPTASESGNAMLSAYLDPTEYSKYYVKLFGSHAKEDGLVWNDAHNSWDKYQLSAGGSTRLSDSASVNVNGWINKGEMDTTNAALENNGQPYTFNILNPSVGTPYVSQIEEAKYRSFGGSFFYGDDFGRIKAVKIGLDLRDITADDDINLYTASGDQSFIGIDGEHRFQGIFVQGTYRPDTVPLDVTVGLREDFFQAVDGSLSGKLAADLSDKSYEQFDPRIGLKYYFSNGVDLRAAWYKDFAAPGMNQMYRSFGSGSSFTVPNPDLTPQSNVGQEVGIDYNQGSQSLAATLFYNRLDDYIDFSATCTTQASCADLASLVGLPGLTTGRQYLNVGDAVIKGLELIGSWQASRTVQLDGGFTRTIAYLTRSDYGSPIGATPAPDPTDAQLGQVPDWMATLGASWQALPRLSLTLQLKSFPSYWNNTSHTQRNDSATLADIGFAYTVSEQTQIYGGIQNLGDRRYYDSGLTTTTRNGSTLSTSGIPTLGMPFNATLGVRASF